VVVELVPAVVQWNRGPLGPLARHPLWDPRVTLLEGDVVQVLQAEQRAFDAILLDVDNGPEDLIRKGNDRLYPEPAWRPSGGPCARAGCWPSGRPGPIRPSPNACTAEAFR
jgi:predicted membrane-bound spermidine synthase